MSPRVRVFQSVTDRWEHELMVLQISRIYTMQSGAGFRNLPLSTSLFNWSAIALNSEGRKYIWDCSCFDSKFECGIGEQS